MNSGWYSSPGTWRWPMIHGMYHHQSTQMKAPARKRMAATRPSATGWKNQPEAFCANGSVVMSRPLRESS
jgi:hypothetical protein